MRILITNDDGVHAPGLQVLERIAHQLGDDVTVVAPETDQSGVAHALSLSEPLRLRRVGDKKFAVRGTPTDCVIMGVREIMAKNKPDLILSGVNRGQNVAEDITYSGTVAAAIEGAILGTPAIALSQAYTTPAQRQHLHWDTAERHAPEIVRKLLAFGAPQGSLFNVNFPDCLPEEVMGTAVTRQGFRAAELFGIDGRMDARGMNYYWISFQRGAFTPKAGTDLEALAARKISVTPLRIDMTDEARLAALGAAFD